MSKSGLADSRKHSVRSSQSQFLFMCPETVAFASNGKTAPFKLYSCIFPSLFYLRFCTLIIAALNIHIFLTPVQPTHQVLISKMPICQPDPWGSPPSRNLRGARNYAYTYIIKDAGSLPVEILEKVRFTLYFPYHTRLNFAGGATDFLQFKLAIYSAAQNGVAGGMLLQKSGRGQSEDEARENIMHYMTQS